MIIFRTSRPTEYLMPSLLLLNRERKTAYQREYYRTHREQCISKVKECVRKRVEIEKRKIII